VATCLQTTVCECDGSCVRFRHQDGSVLLSKGGRHEVVAGTAVEEEDGWMFPEVASQLDEFVTRSRRMIQLCAHRRGNGR
jgi:hypothetical protein